MVHTSQKDVTRHFFSGKGLSLSGLYLHRPLLRRTRGRCRLIRDTRLQNEALLAPLKIRRRCYRRSGVTVGTRMIATSSCIIAPPKVPNAWPF